MGYDASVLAIKDNKAQLVIIAKEISAKTEKNAIFEAERKNVKYVNCSYTTDEIAHAIGKRAGVLVVIDENFAKGLANDTQNRKDDV